MKENSQQQAHTKAAEELIEKFRVKGGNTYNALTRKVRVHVFHGGVPEKALKVRDLEKDGVQAIAKSFLDLGIQHPMEIIGVIWADSSSNMDLNNFSVDLTNVPQTYQHCLWTSQDHRPADVPQKLPQKRFVQVPGLDIADFAQNCCPYQPTPFHRQL